MLTISITMVRLFVGGPPSVEELRRQAGVDNWSELAIGVKDDQPGTAFYNKDGTWSGFDIDIAYMIAEDLGFRRGEVKFYAHGERGPGPDAGHRHGPAPGAGEAGDRQLQHHRRRARRRPA